MNSDNDKSLEDFYYDMLKKNLIEVKRTSRSNKLTELISSTKAVPYIDQILVLDFIKANKN